jgi:hypothetical protein
VGYSAVGELPDLAVVDEERDVDQHPQVGQAHVGRAALVLEHVADATEEVRRVAAVVAGWAAQHDIERDRVGQRRPAGALRGGAGRLQQGAHPAGLAVASGEDGQRLVLQRRQPPDVKSKGFSHDPALRPSNQDVFAENRRRRRPAT